MKMQLYLEKKELAEILKDYVEKETGERPSKLHVKYGIIDVKDLQEWVDKGYFDKKNLLLRLPVVPTITHIKNDGLINAINDVISINHLRVKGEVSVGMILDEKTFNELSCGITCRSGHFNGETFVEFEVEPMKISLETYL